MSDQARDDLVAAMEAVDAYYKASKPWDEDQSREHCYLACSAFISKHGPALLALLDAEPVAGPAGCVCWQSSEWLIPPEKILPACDSFHKGKDGLCGVCDHAEACHARPEASDE